MHYFNSYNATTPPLKNIWNALFYTSLSMFSAVFSQAASCALGTLPAGGGPRVPNPEANANLHLPCSPPNMRADTDSTSAASHQKCQILEILQYTCDIKKDKARAELRCFPVPRIFRM